MVRHISNVKIATNIMTFDMNNIPLVEANMFRRVFINNVEGAIIDNINILNNTSIYTDNFIKSRIRLLPVFIPTTSYNHFIASKPIDSVTLNSPPMRIGHVELNVYSKYKSSDIPSVSYVVSNDITGDLNDGGEITFHDSVVLFKLSHDQHIHLSGDIMLDQGIIDIAYSPVISPKWRYDRPDENTFHKDPDRISMTIETIGGVSLNSIFRRAIEYISVKYMAWKSIKFSK